jgi:hypothetical protein
MARKHTMPIFRESPLSEKTIFTEDTGAVKRSWFVDSISNYTGTS